MIDQNSLTSQQLRAADNAYTAFDFDLYINDAGSWRRSEPDRLTRTIYHDGGRCAFHVHFFPQSAKLGKIYALDLESGCEVGDAVDYLTPVNALHAFLKARWVNAGRPSCAVEMCLWDFERLMDGLHVQHAADSLLVEGAELLEEWANPSSPLSLEETRLIESIGSLKKRV